MRYVDYVNRSKDYKMYVIGGSYFTYKGVQYGKGTKIKFTWDFNQRFLRHTLSKNKYWRPEGDWRINNKYYDPNPSVFNQICIMDGKKTWICGNLAGSGIDVVPDRDIAEIVRPVYYVEPPTPKELAHQRFKDGTWVNYIVNEMFPGYVILMFFAILAQPAQMISGWIVLTAFFAWYTYLKISGQGR